ncbi:MAG: N-acetyl sugar amidotransferase [Gemmatimonadetes bacterium]|nr:N-acetyl sugar amidotransferase [Gemmatimonadota bacterium]
MVQLSGNYPRIRIPAPPIAREGEPGYRRCVYCIMDTTDPLIEFDAVGRCNHCRRVDQWKATGWNPEGDPDALDRLGAKIRADGRGRDYDVIMGLSGGVDSSYVAYLAHRMGLRVLIIHVDTGWNSELAVKNIEGIVTTLGFDLATEVVDWEEMQDLQYSFFKSGVPNQDIPQDHAINAGFYNFAARYGVKWTLSGSNFATEGILPKAWGYDAMDLRHVMDIHRRFGRRKLRTFPRMSYVRFGVMHQLLRGLSIGRPLNLISYDKNEAIRTLESEVGWRYYGGKHYESRFTKFFQGWYLPQKWGYDKRLAHLSSLVASGQYTRDQALDELRTGSLPTQEIELDREYMRRKLGVSAEEFEELMRVPNIPHENYAVTVARLKRAMMMGARIAGVITRRYQGRRG